MQSGWRHRISTITLSELRYGVAKSTHREKNAKALDECTIPLEVVSFNEEAAHVYDDIRASLEKAGTPIGAMDMFIAALALSLGIPLDQQLPRIHTNPRPRYSRLDSLVFYLRTQG